MGNFEKWNYKLWKVKKPVKERKKINVKQIFCQPRQQPSPKLLNGKIRKLKYFGGGWNKKFKHENNIKKFNIETKL